MIRFRDIEDAFEEKYREMIRKVNLVNFQKCLAMWSNLPIDELDKLTFIEYLRKWASNKYFIYELLGKELKMDFDFKFLKDSDEVYNEWRNLIRQYPEYGPWLNAFRRQKENNLRKRNNYDTDEAFYMVNNYFRDKKIDETVSITHFCKRYLKCPDALVTGIGRIYENNEISSFFTISIDPVDIMTASENPYNWDSCYRLDPDYEDCHADGCVAALLDKTTFINYVWTREGNLDLYDTYELKNVRLKRMRQFAGVSKDLQNCFFCDIYPTKGYGEEFEKKWREVVEAHLSQYLGKRNYWKKLDEVPERFYEEYGWGEFRVPIYTLDIENEKRRLIQVYTEPIECLCGCRNTLDGAQGSKYLTGGFTHENFDRSCWCEYCDDYCPYGSEDCDEYCCEECSYWREAHPKCDLDCMTECENPCISVDDGFALSCPYDCKGCQVWEEMGADDEEDDDE